MDKVGIISLQPRLRGWDPLPPRAYVFVLEVRILVYGAVIESL